MNQKVYVFVHSDPDLEPWFYNLNLTHSDPPPPRTSALFSFPPLHPFSSILAFSISGFPFLCCPFLFVFLSLLYWPFSFPSFLYYLFSSPFPTFCWLGTVFLSLSCFYSSHGPTLKKSLLPFHLTFSSLLYAPESWSFHVWINVLYWYRMSYSCRLLWPLKV